MSSSYDPLFQGSLDQIRKDHVESLEKLRPCIAKQSASIQTMITALNSLLPELLEMELRTDDLIEGAQAKDGDALVQSIYASKEVSEKLVSVSNIFKHFKAS